MATFLAVPILPTMARALLTVLLVVAFLAGRLQPSAEELTVGDLDFTDLEESDSGPPRPPPEEDNSLDVEAALRQAEVTIVPGDPGIPGPPPPPPSPTPRPLPPNVEFPIDSSFCAYARITRVGISVNKGGKATMRYDLRVRAIDASVLAEADGEFIRLLSVSEQQTYARLKASYNGGVNIPFLEFLGIDISKPIVPADVVSQQDNLLDFAAKAAAVSRILVSASEQNIRIKGKLKAKGVSCVQTTVFAFIKFAELTLSDGTNRTIMTSARDEVEAATRNGDVVLPSKGKLQIID